jgi:hypothetical protein
MRLALLALSLFWTQLTNSQQKGVSATRQTATSAMLPTRSHGSFGDIPPSSNEFTDSLSRGGIYGADSRTKN